MNRPKRTAFDITSKLVEARLSNTNSSINLATGQEVGEYFQAIYEKISEIAENISKEEP